MLGKVGWEEHGTASGSSFGIGGGERSGFAITALIIIIPLLERLPTAESQWQANTDKNAHH
jgi:hypothetical protein